MWDKAQIEAKWEVWTERVERVRKTVRPLQKRVALFLAVMGPGLIVSNVDNDAGGIYTYAQSGAQFGYLVLWSLIPMTVVLYVSLEMCSRMGAITGKGLSDLIREEFGFRVTFFLMALVLVINLGNVMAEFTGVAYAMDVFGVSKYVSVPIAAILVWVLVVKGTAARVEKIFLTVCVVYLTYVISAILAKPDWLVSLLYLLPPQLIRLIPEMKPVIEAPPLSASYFLILAGLVGTTIAPWQHFYLQAAVVEKKLGPRQYPTTRNDVTVGSISCMVIVFFIIVCTAATLHVNGIRDIDNARTAAMALKPLAGNWASDLFAIGLLNASLFAASVLPLSTSYVVCEAMGFESGIDHKFNDAKIFYGLYTALIVIGAALILVLPNSWQNGVLLLSQVGNAFLLLPIMVVILLLVNRRDLMGDYVNSRSFNWVAWVSTVALVLLTCVLLYTGVASMFKSP
jgi:NRAMP (natural resistance-associated macrophage protein)-like metal ion transporter